MGSLRIFDRRAEAWELENATRADQAGQSPEMITRFCFSRMSMLSIGTDGMTYLRENLAQTAAFMEQVHAEIQYTQYGQEAQQSGLD
jgi:hypothetical protein